MEGNVSVQAYEEFPSDKAYYDRIDGGRAYVHFLHFAYNAAATRGHEYFVEPLATSPTHAARAEIQRINDEVLKLVLGAAADDPTGSQVRPARQVMEHDAVPAARRSRRRCAARAKITRNNWRRRFLRGDGRAHRAAERQGGTWAGPAKAREPCRLHRTSTPSSRIRVGHQSCIPEPSPRPRWKKWRSSCSRSWWAR